MSIFRKISKLILVGSLVMMGGIAGCTKKPSQEELQKLEEARSAAESAEKKLAELRQERAGLESQLSAKEGVLKEHEVERDDLKQKMEQHDQVQE